MNEMQKEAGELGDAELAMVTGGVKAGSSEELAQTAERVDHIQSLLSEIAHPNSSPFSAGPLRPKSALLPDEAMLVKDFQGVLATFEKTHHLDDKDGKAMQSDKEVLDDRLGGVRAPVAPGAPGGAVPKPKLDDPESGPKRLQKDDMFGQDKAPSSQSTKGGVLSEVEVAKLARVEKVLEKIASLDDPMSKKKTAQGQLEDSIDQVMKKAKSQGLPYPDKEIDTLRKAEKNRVSAIEQERDREEKTLVAEAKKQGKPFPRDAIEELTARTKRKIDGTDDLPDTRAGLFAELKSLKTDFQKIQASEEGNKSLKTDFQKIQASEAGKRI